MAFRGRGRGRGGRGFGGGFEFRPVAPKPFIEYPEDVILPSLPSEDLSPTQIEMIEEKTKRLFFWKRSCYVIEDFDLKSKSQGAHIESSVRSRLKAKREALAYNLKLTHLPAELVQGSKHLQRNQKKIRLDRDPDEKLFSMFEKLEETSKGGEGKEKEKGNESEDEEVEEEAEEESSDDDYNQNIDFDDDDDDMNMDDGADEDAYED